MNYQEVYIERLFGDICQNFHLWKVLHQKYHVRLLVQEEERNVPYVEEHPNDHSLRDMIKITLRFYVLTYVDRKYRQMSTKNQSILFLFLKINRNLLDPFFHHC